MRNVGTLTSALALLGLGVLLLIDMLGESQHFYTVVRFWPVLLIGLGLEYLWCLYSSRKKGLSEKIRIDARSVAMLCLVGVFAIAFYTTQQVRGYVQTSIMSLGDSFRDKSVDLPLVTQELQGVKGIELYNKTGNIKVVRSADSKLQIRAKAHVRQLTEKQTEVESEKWNPKITKGQITRIETNSALFDDGNITSMDLEISVPDNLNMQIITQYGSVSVTDRKGDVIVSSGSGTIDVSNIQGVVTIGGSGTAKVNNVQGDVEVKGNAERIYVDSVSGNANLESSFVGEIHASNIGGSIRANCGNGRIQLDNIVGKVEARSDNGMIQVSKVGSEMLLDAAQGGISIESPIAGKWSLHSTSGVITMKIPRNSEIKFLGESSRGVVKGPTKSDSNAQGSHVSEEMGIGKYPVTARTEDGAITVTLTD